ncbi:hypothetical protein [Geomonas edaphica]|uniref:hypothetical protein n=1 Tax=Geomonas edaphica TaxID=2570226 RepID=UPI0010A78013|nr:hypothetical protein [Geomonas edaphica]
MPKRKYKSPSSDELKKYTSWQYAKLLSLRSDEDGETVEQINVGDRVCKVIPHSKSNEATGHIYKSTLIDERYRFDNTQDPHSAITIFTECFEKGYYPPDDVVAFLYDKFKKYMNSDESLDKTLRIGKRIKKNYRLFYRNRDIIIDIDTLKFRFGLDHLDAVTAVTRKYADLGCDLSEETIDQIYTKGIKSQRNKSLMYLHSELFQNYYYEEDDDIQIEFGTDSSYILLEILLQYPDDVVDDLKNRYPKIKSLLDRPIEKLEPDKSV